MRGALASLLLVAAATGEARADEPSASDVEPFKLSTDESKPATLDPGAPPTLPSLTHADAALELNYTGAGIGQGSLGSAFTWMAQVAGEVPLTTRHWHAGAAWDVVSAAAEGRGRALLYGNPELWVRGVGWHASGLSTGGGLGVIVPLPRDLGRDSQSVLEVIRVIRPWDSGYFESETLTLRPVVDARLVLEPFVLQLRQGIDWSYAFDRARSDIIARTGTYVGLEPVSFLTLGLELWQTYSITAEVADDERAAFTLSPSIRVKLSPLEPALSLLFPINTPLQGIATEYLALRVHVRLALGETAAVP
ncbi:MAG: hypothetical protein JNK04_24715 [Myxococcales bacterium]|nr:hypothetical protein [Myxococcales bacterium]